MCMKESKFHDPSHLTQHNFSATLVQSTHFSPPSPPSVSIYMSKSPKVQIQICITVQVYATVYAHDDAAFADIESAMHSADFSQIERV